MASTAVAWLVVLVEPEEGLATDSKRRSAAAATVVAVMAFIALGMLVAGASGSFDAREGSYKGKTDQGLRVSFKVKHHEVKNPKFEILYGASQRST
jgi:heme A synthase